MYRRSQSGLGATMPAGYSLIGDGVCMFGGQNGKGGSPMPGYAPPDWFFTSSPSGMVQCLSAAQVKAFGGGLVTPGAGNSATVTIPGTENVTAAAMAGNFLESIIPWVRANPLLAAGAALGIVFLVKS